MTPGEVNVLAAAIRLANLPPTPIDDEGLNAAVSTLRSAVRDWRREHWGIPPSLKVHTPQDPTDPHGTQRR